MSFFDFLCVLYTINAPLDSSRRSWLSSPAHFGSSFNSQGNNFIQLRLGLNKHSSNYSSYRSSPLPTLPRYHISAALNTAQCAAGYSESAGQNHKIIWRKKAWELLMGGVFSQDSRFGVSEVAAPSLQSLIANFPSAQSRFNYRGVHLQSIEQTPAMEFCSQHSP